MSGRIFLLVALLAVGSARAMPIVHTSQSAFDAAIGPPTVLDMELGANGIAVSTQYAGVIAAGFNGGTPSTSTFTPRSGTYSLLGGGFGAGGGGFSLSFDSGQAGVGLHVGGLQFPGTTFSGFDVDAGQLFSFDVRDHLPVNAAGYDFIGVTASTAIHSVQVAAASNDFVFYDDIRFGPAVPISPATGVPAPHAVWLLGISMFVMARRRRCRSTELIVGASSANTRTTGVV